MTTVESIKTIDNEMCDAYELELNVNGKPLYVGLWPSDEDWLSDTFTVCETSYFDLKPGDPEPEFIENLVTDEDPRGEAFMNKVRASKYWPYYELLLHYFRVNEGERFPRPEA